MQQSSSPGLPYPAALHPGALSNKISCFVSTCVSSDNSFPSVRQEPSFRPWKGSLFLQQMVNLVGFFFAETDVLTAQASLPANEPDPVAETGTFLSLVSS